MVLAFIEDRLDLNTDYPLDRYGEWFFGVGAPSAIKPADGGVTKVAIIDSLRDDIDVADYTPGESINIEAEAFRGGAVFYSAGNATSRVFPTLLEAQSFRDRFAGFDAAANALEAENKFREVVAFPMPLVATAFTDENLGPFRADDVPAPFAEAQPANIVVVIDDAINPLHHRFRDETGASRVDFVWDMAYPWDQDDPVDVKVPFGREWSASELDAIIERHPDDEAAQLREIRFGDRSRVGPNPSLRRVTHGTHVADLATGGLGAQDRIIAISLPPVAVAETNGGILGAMLVFALEYALQRIRDLLGEVNTVPVLFNLSLATNGGPRDGTHLVALAMEDVISAYPAATFVLPAGNQFLAEAHVSVPVKDGVAHLDVGLKLRSGDRSANFVEFWLPENTGDVTLRLSHPYRKDSADPSLPERVEWVLTPDNAMLLTEDGENIGRVTFDGALRIGNDRCKRRRLLLALQPTEATPVPPPKDGEPLPPTMEKPPLAPAGRWGVEIVAEAMPPGETIEGWIQRDGAPFGYPERGKMATFSDPTYRRRDATGRLINQTEAPQHWPSQILRRGTLSALATHPFERFYVVGGRFGRTVSGQPEMAPYSAASDCAWQTPHFSAVTEDSKVLRGVKAAGTRGQSFGRLSGTSVAVPQLVRKLATGSGIQPSPSIDPLRDGGRI